MGPGVESGMAGRRQRQGSVRHPLPAPVTATSEVAGTAATAAAALPNRVGWVGRIAGRRMFAYFLPT